MVIFGVRILSILAFLAAAFFLCLKPLWRRLAPADRLRLALVVAVSFVLFTATDAGIRVFQKMGKTAERFSHISLARRQGPGYKTAVKDVYKWYWEATEIRDRILRRGIRTVALELKNLEGIPYLNNYQRLCEILCPVRLDPAAPYRIRVTAEKDNLTFELVKERP